MFQLTDMPVEVITLIFGSFGFGAQIYLDFSGYSLIALGGAALLGIKLPANFRRPYNAASPREFWLRWHISLSNWIREYLYVGLYRSLFGNDKPPVMWLFFCWGLMGLWHGTTINFLLWGLYHAALIWIYRICPSLGIRQNDVQPFVLAKKFLLLFLINMGWFLFRYHGDILEASLSFRSVDLTKANAYLVVSIVWLSIVIAGQPSLRRLIARNRMLATSAFIFYTLVFAGSGSNFIYFAF